MHAAEYGTGGSSVRKSEGNDKREDDNRNSPKVPLSRQNGAALPEETAQSGGVNVKVEASSDTEEQQRQQQSRAAAPARLAGRRSTASSTKIPKTERKRRSVDESAGASSPKKVCLEERERFLDVMVGDIEGLDLDTLAAKAEELRNEVQVSFRNFNPNDKTRKFQFNL